MTYHYRNGEPLCGDSCPDGWRSIVDPVLGKLEDMGVRIAQVKEKFGGLRIYYDSPINRDADVLIRDAELACATACVCCGAPGVRATDRWTGALCAEHKGGRS